MLLFITLCLINISIFLLFYSFILYILLNLLTFLYLFYSTNLFIFIIISFFNTNLAISFNLANHIFYNAFTHNALVIIGKVYSSFYLARPKKCLLIKLKYYGYLTFLHKI